MANLKIFYLEYRETTIEDIQKIEEEIQLQIPADFKDFLLQHQGKINFEPNHVVVNYKKYNRTDDIAVVDIDNIDGLLSSFNALKDYEDCKDILGFGNTLGGSFWGISLNIEDYNSVYLFESHLERTKVADSFSDFLNKIVFEEGSIYDLL